MRTMWLCPPTASPGSALVADPVAQHVPVIREPVTVDMVHVPAVLPFRGLVGEVEPAPQPREMDARRQRRIAQQVVATPRGILAAVFEVDGERRAAREDEAAGDGGELVAEFLASEPVLSKLDGRTKARRTSRDRGATALAAAELHQAVDAQRPPVRRLDRPVHAEHFRPAGGEAVAERDAVRVRKPRERTTGSAGRNESTARSWIASPMAWWWPASSTA